MLCAKHDHFPPPHKDLPSRHSAGQEIQPHKKSSRMTQDGRRARLLPHRPRSRPRPSPAFNREDYSDVQPLKPYRTTRHGPLLCGHDGWRDIPRDDAPPGRQAHLYGQFLPNLQIFTLTIMIQSATLVALSSQFSMRFTNQNTSILFCHGMNRALATWLKDMLVPAASLA